jgi:hypothetical protein
MVKLDDAIRFTQEAVDATLEGHPNCAQQLNKVGVRLHNRYLRTGAMADLEDAIRFTQEAINVTLEDNQCVGKN